MSLEKWNQTHPGQKGSLTTLVAIALVPSVSLPLLCFPLPSEYEQWSLVWGLSLLLGPSESSHIFMCSVIYSVSHSPAWGYFGTCAVLLTTAEKIKYYRGDKKYSKFI